MNNKIVYKKLCCVRTSTHFLTSLHTQMQHTTYRQVKTSTEWVGHTQFSALRLAFTLAELKSGIAVHVLVRFKPTGQ